MNTYSYNGYYIAEHDTEFELNTMKNHIKGTECPQRWTFIKGGEDGFVNIEEVIEYLENYFLKLGESKLVKLS